LLEHRPLDNGGFKEGSRGVCIELKKFDGFAVDTACKVKPAVEVPVDIVFPAFGNKLNKVERNAYFMKEVIVNDMLCRFDIHFIEYIARFIVGFGLFGGKYYQFVRDIRSFVTVGVPDKTERLKIVSGQW